MVDIETQLRAFGEQLDAARHPVSIEDLLTDPDGVTRIHPLPVDAAVTRRRGWAVAVVAAILTLLLGGVAWVSGVGREPAPAATTERSTTIAELPGAAPLDVAEAWIEAYEQGDPARWQALMAPDATFTCDVCAGTGMPEGPYFDYPGRDMPSEDARDSQLLHAAHGSLNATCTADGIEVSCDTMRTNLFQRDDGQGQLTGQQVGHLVFTVEDELIVGYEIVVLDGQWFDYSAITDYANWLRVNHPADHDELFVGATMLVSDAEQVARHRELIPTWAAARP